MGIKFVGGPYNGKEAEHTDVLLHAGLLPLKGDVGQRLFVLMPPLESWARLLHGESAETTPVYPYEQVMTPDGPRFEWPPDGALVQAVWESRLKVNLRARTALSTLATDLRSSIIRVVAALQRVPPEKWSKEHTTRITNDKPVYLVHLPGALRAVVRTLDTGQLELLNIVREDMLPQGSVSMSDVITREPIRVSTHATAGSSIMLPADQVDRVRQILDQHSISYWVDHTIISVDGNPPTAWIYLGRQTDPNQVQLLLDAT
jgi:hypothetical protein